MEAYILLCVSVFSVTCILLFPPHSIVSGDVLINCGSKWNSSSLDGRKWTGESASASISGQSTTSVVPATSFLGADPVPYITSRISSSPFYFTFHVSPGQKFIRLHFYPGLYRGFEKSFDFFTVKAGPFIFLQDFSPTHSSSGSKFIVKEFCLNVEQHGKLRITFSPSKAHMTYAFVNGIEIASMPTGLYYTPDGDAGASVVGQNNRFYGIDNHTALGMVQRLSIRGGYISSVEDFRQWNSDAAYFQESGADWKFAAQQLKSFTWKIPITSGFGYLVRLHFGDWDAAAVADGERKEFIILIDNQIAEVCNDVMRCSGGAGFPVHKDYVVMMKGDKEGTESDLIIGLQSINERSLRFLKGVEIFRLSNLQNSLAYSCSGPAVLNKVSTNWNLKVVRSFLSLFSQSGVIGAGMLVIILIVNAAVYSLRVIPEENYQNNVNDAAVGEPSHRLFSLADIKSATQNFSDAFMIGKGGYGEVYKGRICGFPGTVAIKRLSSRSKQGDREFRAEIESLSKLRHLNLVSLIGYCCEDKEMILVYEYISGGTLDDNLGKNARKGKGYTLLSWEDRLGICIGVARGLEYLHSGSKPGIVHRDVKGTNILLDEKLVAKISDFGLSKLEESQTHISIHCKGTRGYLDPHYKLTRRSTKKSDVYSFGVVMLVVLAGTGEPVDAEMLVARFKDCVSIGEFDNLVDAEISNSISDASLKEFVKCAEKCMQQKPENRPSMAQLVVSLEQVLQPQKETVQHSESGEMNLQVLVPEEPMDRPWISRWLPLTTEKLLLPVDYRDILSRSPDGLALLDSSMPKERLYQHLCDNLILIDNGTMSFTLDKASGKKNFMLSARALHIVWSEVPKHWKFIPVATSRFNLVALLVSVCWLDFHGVISSKMLSPNTRYTFNLVFALASKFDWANYPTEVSVGFNGQQWQTKYVLFNANDGSGVLRSMRATKNMREALVQTQTVKQRSDGWLEIELGEIYIEEGEDNDIGVRVAEVETNAWKHGLVIEGIDIRAKME